MQEIPTTVDAGATYDRGVPLLIVGMHRSGTSCLAGSLQSLGLHSGRVHEWNPHNLKGNRESERVTVLNDAVLAQNGASWDQPPTGAIQWTAAHEAERDAIRSELERGCDQFWGFKDPRTLLVVEFWLEGIPDATFAGTFRHPAQVARSLHARGKMPIEQGVKLWSAYNQRLLDLHARRPFPILCFDLGPEQYLLAIDRLARDMGLLRGASAPPFFEKALRSSEDKMEGIQVTASAIDLYERLQRAACADNQQSCVVTP